jgi:transposase-like protein
MPGGRIGDDRTPGEDVRGWSDVSGGHVLLPARRDAAAAPRFFTRALRMLTVSPAEVVTDAAPVYPGLLDELVPAAWHHVEQYANNPDRSRSRPAQTPAETKCADYRW